MDRRTFLQHSSKLLLGGALAPYLPHSVLAEQKQKKKPVLVVLYLRGGADPLNMLIPYKDPRYYKMRKSIAIPSNRVIPLGQSLFGLHPSLEALEGLIKGGSCAPIINVGSPHPTRSHFDAQKFMEYADPGNKSQTQGWLNRYLQSTQTPEDSPLRAIGFQATLPRSLRGNYPALALNQSDSFESINFFKRFYQDQRIPNNASPLHSPSDEILSRIHNSGKHTVSTLKLLNQVLSSEQQSRHSYRRGIEGQFQKIKNFIKADVGFEVAAFDYNGWDHHVNEGGLNGQMATKMSRLSSAISKFVYELGSDFNRTLLLVMSEFGRTAFENGNKGTDHGHGGIMFAIGGMVKGKKIYGDWLGLSSKKLYQNRDLPVTTDFRSVFNESLNKLYNIESSNLFPKFRRQKKILEFLT